MLAGPPAGDVLPLPISGDIVYVAANGEELHTTFVGTASLNVVTGVIEFAATELLVDGTGRFANASGTSYLEGHASAATQTGFYVTLGTISY